MKRARFSDPPKPPGKPPEEPDPDAPVPVEEPPAPIPIPPDKPPEPLHAMVSARGEAPATSPSLPAQASGPRAATMSRVGRCPA